ncbi:hypothetical protein LIER_38766 [Lithospermum erythrorhizon]|uniref:Uncharacterized protein n=1 Tax=Lithospermum erythrorhizon TaxID=34254 RepID=A0AAV3Q8K6_LITER
MSHRLQESKAVKKVDSSPRPASQTIHTPRSSPIMAEPISSSLPSSAADLPRESHSPSLAEKRPLEGTVTQGKEKQAKAASELSDPPKGGIPPPPLYSSCIIPLLRSSDGCRVF